DLEPARLYHYDDARVRELFDRLEFRSLLTRLPGRDEDGGGNGQTSLGLAGQTEVLRRAPAAGQTSISTATTAAPQVDVVILDAHTAAEASERITAAGAVDVRTIIDGNARTGDIVGVALAVPGVAVAYYLPSVDGNLAERAEPEAIATVE